MGLPGEVGKQSISRLQPHAHAPRLLTGTLVQPGRDIPMVDKDEREVKRGR